MKSFVHVGGHNVDIMDVPEDQPAPDGTGRHVRVVEDVVEVYRSVKEVA